MSDNHDNDEVDTLAGETDDQIRAAMRALAHEVGERADVEAALERMPRRSGPSAARFLAIAAGVLAVVALAIALVPDDETVGTTDQPQTTDCPDTEGALAPTRTPGGEMNTRLAAPVATAATAIMLIGACGDDDGPTLLARGENVEMIGEAGIAEATLNLDAQEEDGEVTGEFRVGPYVHAVQCADTSTDGLVILGGEVTASPDEPAIGALDALIIREGDPDTVAIFGNDIAAASCNELLESIPQEFLDDDFNFHELEAGSDIETG